MMARLPVVFYFELQALTTTTYCAAAEIISIGQAFQDCETVCLSSLILLPGSQHTLHPAVLRIMLLDAQPGKVGPWCSSVHVHPQVVTLLDQQCLISNTEFVQCL
jgi:hypothetical protein